MSSNFFDQFDESTARPVGKGGNFFDQFDPTGAKPVPKTNLLDDVKDSAIALGTGVTQGIGMLANVAGADNAVSRTMADATQALSEYESPHRKAEKQERARKIKEAEESGSTLKEVGAYLGSFAEAPIDTTLNALGTSLPTLAAGFIPGAGQAAVAARVAQLGLGAAQGVGAVKGQIFDEVKQAWKEKGATEEDASARAAQAQSYTGDNAGSIALGGALGAVAGSSGAEASVRRLAGKEVAERAAQTSVLKGMGMGALKEAPMEGLQGGQERLASNLALQNEGFDQGTWTGVAGGAALEATASAPMGAGFGAWEAGSRQRLAQQEQQRRTEIEQQLQSVPEHQQPAARAQLNAELNAQMQAEARAAGLMDEEQGPPDVPPGNPNDYRATPSWAKPPEDAATDYSSPDDEVFQSTGRPVAPAREALQQSAAAGGALSTAALVAIDNGAAPTFMPPPLEKQPQEQQAEPVVLQNRDRTSQASISQMQSIAAAPDYIRAGPSAEMATGAPVVFGDLPSTALLGRNQMVVDGHGARVATQYAIVDAGDLIASNNADGTPVAEYAHGLPGKLRAVAGNGRTAGLQAAYQMGTAQKSYTPELLDSAQELGIDRQAVAAMKRPVLVRLMDQKDVTPDMGDRTNITGTQKLSPVEQAANDARRFDITNLAFDEGGNPTAKSIAGFVSSMPVSEQGDMMNPDGSPTRQAVDRLMAATFKQAYDSDELVQLYAQAADPDARAVLSAAADASGVMAALSGTEFDVRQAVADAVKMAVNASRQGLKLSDVLQNADFDMNPEAYPVATFLAQNIRSPKAMAEGLRRWGQLALQQARVAEENKYQGNLLGDPTPTLSRQEILARIGDAYNPTEQAVAGRAQPQAEQASMEPAPPAPLMVPGNFGGTPAATIGTRMDAVAGPGFGPTSLKDALAQIRARKQTKQPTEAKTNAPTPINDGAQAAPTPSAQNQAQAPAAPQQTPTWATMPTEARQQVIQAAGLNKPQATKALATNSIEEMPAAIADKLAPVLTSYTAADIEAQQAQQQQAANAEAARQRAESAAATQADDRKRIAQASVAAADTFELGGDAMQNLTGQGSLLDAPGQPAAGREGYDTPVQLDAANLKAIIEKTRGEPLVDKPAKLEAWRNGTAKTDPTKFPIELSFRPDGQLDVNDGRHRIALAAERGEKVTAFIDGKDAQRVQELVSKPNQPAARTQQAQAATENAADTNTQEGAAKAQETVEDELSQRGKLVADFVQAVISGSAHPNSIRVGPISADAGQRMAEKTAVPVQGAVEIVIADSVIHANKRHPDLTLEDWSRLPEVTNAFDDASLGQPGPNQNMARIVVRKSTQADGSGYGAVYDFAAGGNKGRKKLNLVTYFRGTEKSLNSWWEKNKGADPAAVPNLPEPASSARDDVSAPSGASLPPTAAAAQPVTRADVEAAQQQAAAIMGARIDAMSAGSKFNARQAQEAGFKAREEAKKAQRQAKRTQAAPEDTGLRVGVAPGSADPVTVRDGVVLIGDYEAVNYDTGEPVTVPKGSTRADVAQALKNAGALSSRQKMFGLGDKAQDVMFSQNLLSPAASAPKPTLDQIQRLVDKVQQLAKDGFLVRVTSSPVNVPGVKVPAGAKPTGAVIDGNIYLFTDNLSSIGDAYVTMFHEIFHLGLQKVLPAEDYATVLKQFASNPLAAKFVRQWKASAEGTEKAAKMPSAAYEALATEEALAMIAEELSVNDGEGTRNMPGLVKKMLSWFAQVADKLGFPPNFSNWVRNLTRTDAERFVNDMTRAVLGGSKNLAKTKAKYGTMAAEMTAQDRLRAPPVVYHGTKSALTQFDPANSDIRFSRAPAAAPAFDFAAMAKAVLAGTPQKDKDAVVNRVRQTIAPMRAAWGANAPEVEVVFNMSDPRVPQVMRSLDMAQRRNGADGEPHGFYHRGKVYLVASQLATPNDMVRVLAHEVLGHHGLRGKFGPQLDGILSQIATMRKAQVQEKMRQYGLRDTPANRAHAAEEVLAEMAEKQPQLPFVRRAVAAIRNFLRAHVQGFKSLALKDDDIIQAFLLPARGWVERSGRGAGAGSELDEAVPAMQRGGVEDDVAFSRASQAKAVGDVDSAWDAPVQTGFDDVIYKLQDKHIDLKRVVESITKSVGKVADDINAYLKEELFHKRAAKRVADFGARELTPLMNQMRLAGLSMEDVEEYLHARHAKEANAALAERNPSQAMINAGRAKAAQEVTALAAKLEAVTDKTQRGILQNALGNATKELNRWNVVVPYKGTEESRLMLSGMSDKDADSYFAKLDPAQRAKLDAVAKKVDAIIAGTRKLYVDYGLEDQAVVDGWASLYKHYIPLMREDKDGGMGIGQGFSVKGKEVKGRTGSTRKVVDILANIASQREKLIVRGEKNRVIQALVGLAQANPNPDFWEVRSQAPTERVVDEATNTVVERPIPNFKGRDNVVVAKTKDSKGNVTEQMVVFNEDNPRAVRMAAALKNLDAGNLEGLLGVSAKITRYFAAINTQYNPVFGVVNLIRDVQGAMVNLAATPLAGQQAKIAKDTFSALLGIYSDIRKTRKGGEATSQWAQLWEQMQEDGGTTGYREMFQTSADRANNLKSILNPEGWMDSKWGKVFTANGQLKVPMSIAQKGAAEIFGWLSDYNEAMENGVRLAAYKAALDKKMSREQAASIAKNLTVNFNRKGQMGQQAGAVYAFFNAAMQGTARIGQTLFDMDGGDISTLRLSKTGKAVVYGGVTLGVIQALLLAAAGFDDEDPPEFLRERSLIIPVGGKAYVTIPMPLGLHVIPGIGRHATEFALSGFDKPAKRAVSVIGMFADAFNPIGNAGLSMQTLAPTALDPLVALTENKDSFGRTIARTSFNKALPGHTQWKDTATGFSKVVAEAINWVSGGNEYVAGALSPTPDQIDYLLAQLGGGVAREIAKVQQTISTAISGEELPTYKIPLVGRFVGSAASQASQGNAFYANLERMNELETEIKGLRKDGKYAEAAQLARENPASMMIAMANKAERDVQKLRREKRELIANNASREQVRAKEQQITAVMTRLNEAAVRRLAPA